MEIGNLIRYTGIVITTNITWESLYNELTEGKQYKILDIKHVNRDGYTYCLIKSDENLKTWFPMDIFNKYCRELMIKKYDLR